MPKNSSSTSHDIHNNKLYTEPFDLGGVSLRPIDLLEHLLATGGTGSGKTRCFMMPLIEKVLKRFGNSPDEKAGMFLIDAKGDMSQLAAECVRRAGRGDDLYILGEDGNCWFPLFDQFDGDPTMIANFLFEILEDRTKSGALGRSASNESFWEENARRMLRAAVILAKATQGKSLGGLSEIANAVNSIFLCNDATQHDDGDEADYGDLPCSSRKVLRHLKDTAELAYRAGRISALESQEFIKYLMNDVSCGNPNTWATIGNLTRNYLAQFSQPALRRLFEPSPNKRRVSPEDIINGGAIVIVSLSPVIYGEGAAPFRAAVKRAFSTRMLQRPHLFMMDNGKLRQMNQVRPVLYVCDEFHTTLSSGRNGDAFFLDRTRDFRCMCVLATQGISGIQAMLGDTHSCNHLLNNCRTKFFFANDCPQTLNYFEELGGKDRSKVEHISYVPSKAPPRFRLPNHTFSSPKARKMSGITYSPGAAPRFDSAILGALPNGSAIVVTKGRKQTRFQMDPKGYGTA